MHIFELQNCVIQRNACFTGNCWINIDHLTLTATKVNRWMIMSREIIVENSSFITHSYISNAKSQSMHRKKSKSLIQCIIRCLFIFCSLIYFKKLETQNIYIGYFQGLNSKHFELQKLLVIRYTFTVDA